MIGRGVRALLIFAAVACLVACEARYRDVSDRQDHRARIGLDCELTTFTRAHGVTLPTSPYRQTDYVSIWNPGFTGPEMTFLRIL